MILDGAVIEGAAPSERRRLGSHATEQIVKVPRSHVLSTLSEITDTIRSGDPDKAEALVRGQILHTSFKILNVDLPQALKAHVEKISPHDFEPIQDDDEKG